MSDCFVLYLLLTCMKKKTSGADKFTNNSMHRLIMGMEHLPKLNQEAGLIQKQSLAQS